MEISITRALALVKHKKTQLDEAIRSNMAFTGVVLGEQQDCQTPGMTSELLRTKLQSNNDKVTTLLKDIIGLKQKINNSNSVTMVTIAGRQMSVANAIVEKAFLPQKEQLLEAYKRSYNSSAATIKQNEEKLQARIDQLVTAMVNEETTDPDKKKKNLEEIKLIHDNQKRLLGSVLFDPCSIVKAIETLTEEIQFLKSEFDYVLSTSNTVTMIDDQTV